MLFTNCTNSIHTGFKIHKKSQDVKLLMELGATLCVFPVISKEYEDYPPYLNTAKMTEYLNMQQKHLEVFPYFLIEEKIIQKGYKFYLLQLLNEYYDLGETRSKILALINSVAKENDIEFIMLLRLKSANSYKNLSNLYTRKIKLSGTIINVETGKEIWTFTSASLSHDNIQKLLASKTDLINTAMENIAKNMPFDAKLSELPTSKKNW